MAGSTASSTTAKAQVGYLRLVPGLVRKSDRFAVRYVTSTGESVVICPISSERAAFTSVRSPSGTGKSTLLSRFVARLRDRAGSEAGQLDFTLTDSTGGRPSLAIGMVPQHPPLVKHWGVERLLTKGSWAAAFTFGEEIWANLSRRAIGQLSGGQQRRLYACSVAEFLSEKDADASLLILDETLDGLNPNGAAEFVDRLSVAWEKKKSHPLNMLIVTHLPDIPAKAEACTAGLVLEVQDDSASELRVRVGVSVK